MLYSLLFLSILIIFISYYAISKSGSINEIKTSNQQISFQTLTSDKNNVEFQVTPLSPSEFQIVINTHSVDLDFDLAQISTLYDDIGNEYKPLKWEDSVPGSHHREGILKFPEIDKNAKSIKLVITDSARREFVWDLK